MCDECRRILKSDVYSSTRACASRSRATHEAGAEARTNLIDLCEWGRRLLPSRFFGIDSGCFESFYKKTRDVPRTHPDSDPFSHFTLPHTKMQAELENRIRELESAMLEGTE